MVAHAITKRMTTWALLCVIPLLTGGAFGNSQEKDKGFTLHESFHGSVNSVGLGFYAAFC